MKVLIAEDEITATKKIEALLKRVRPEAEVVARLESVKETVAWIGQNERPTIAFFDVQLADDISFEIFKLCEVTFPIIFVTAYDDFMLQAFEQNTIHYLLKPITEEKIRESLEKFERMSAYFAGAIRAEEMNLSKQKILVRKGVSFVPLEVNKIAYIYSEHKISFAKDENGTIYLIDQSLTELEKVLDPGRFFRVNRQYLVQVHAINNYRSIDQSKIKLDLTPPTKENVIIGKENAVLFRKWIKEIV